MSLQPITDLKKRIRSALQRSSQGYRFYLNRDYGGRRPTGNPDAPWHNKVLSSRKEWEDAFRQANNLGLPIMNLPFKTWDSLAALDLILKSTTPSSRIFDAGGVAESNILPWLFLYGYRNLIVGNLDVKKSFRRGPIRFQYEDITRTDFPEQYFDAIACMSVIEHGVNTEVFLKESSRILKTGGLLVLSTDYFQTSIDTAGLEAFGAPVKIFNRIEIEKLMDDARKVGFEILSIPDLRSPEKPITWDEFDLSYTFITLSFQLRSK